MLKCMSRRSRSLLSLCLTSLALTLSVLAFCTSYWCEGTHKVVKPLCLSPVKMNNCGQNDSQPYTTESPTPDPKTPESNATVSLKQKEEKALMKAKKLANAVHYIWETGEDKYMLRYFHTGFWLSCEKHHSSEGEKCRSFIELTPGEAQGKHVFLTLTIKKYVIVFHVWGLFFISSGVLWLSLFSEFMYITLLAMGFLMMWMELLLLCLNKEMYALKINAFAAICTVLSGMMGMVAHMMYTTVFQLTVSIGPKDWRPQTWDYGWSFALAWISFSCCMAAAVFTLNSYTKMVIETNHRARIRLEEAASHAPPYDDIIMAGASGSIYSINLPVQHCQQGKLIDTTWPSRKEVLPGVMMEGMNSDGLLMLGR
ncbi:hypothetical protein QTP70_031919 [Hemibagrus guttatus]|uniref:Germ cell-specific gene 1-like protein n=1 Tax=Hemibagrus guttatus TaxID=175788 RepID=A0AAE0UK89_9TELE|nr:hypothetical protein QTP70_031919 [Hemibagrus guttatus]